MKPLSRSAAPSDHAAERLERAALCYLARRDRSEAQVRAYLTRAGATQPQIATLLGQFRRHGYVNDVAHAGRWAETRLARRPMGRDRLEAELTAQGFEPATVAAAVAQAYERRTEKELALTLLRQRGHLPTAAKQAWLLRRHGFSDDTIQHCVGDQDA